MSRRGLSKLMPSPRQIDILEFIENYKLASDFHPTATDLCEGLGMHAGHISRDIKYLERKGYIERSPHARGAQIRVIKDYTHVVKYYQTRKAIKGLVNEYEESTQKEFSPYAD